jgi:hydrogenase-4 membrane subunit HyfE
MTTLLMAFVGVLLAPLFIGKWRASLLGLACQGGLMAWTAYRLGVSPRSPVGLLLLIDLAVLRGVAAPLALYRVLRRAGAPPRNDVIPPNLVSWTIALGCVLLAFNFAGALVTHGGEERTLVATASSALLLGFLVLASQTGTFSQIVGVLRCENAIALFELGGSSPPSLAAESGLVGVLIGTIVLYRWYLSNLGVPPKTAASPAVEGPTL